MKIENKMVVLIVDDSPDTQELIRRYLELEDFVTFTASGAEGALRILVNQRIDILITDYKMPKITGFDLIKHAREHYPDLGIMMVTGYATIDGAVTAMKLGADEYISKPFTEEELIGSISKLKEKILIQQKIKNPTTKSGFHGIIGDSPQMKQVFATIEKAAMSTATVLITGESGTGKELIARAIHYQSKRSKAPFVPVNCAAIPSELLESELFGYMKGAFTGADTTRPGFFQTANGGSIFLDEVSEMSTVMQAKLLRAIQEREVMMVGSRQAIKVDIRIICATNKNLQSLVENRLFREDLFYRLNVINIDLPSLSQRKDDVFTLINHFNVKFSREINRPIITFSDRAIEVMKNYNWPGNVRELENLIQRLTVMSETGVIDVKDLPVYMRSNIQIENGYNRTLEEVENEYIKNVLNSVEGNKTKAAKILGIDRKTLRAKLGEE